MMNRRTLLNLAATAVAASAFPVSPLFAQTARRSGRANLLVVGGGPMNLGPQGLLQGLDEHGLAEGRDYALRYFDEAGGSLEREMQQTPTDVIFAVGSRGVNLARAATRSVPIVAIDLESEPIADGLIAGFARPGGNVTGTFLDQPALATKWLQYLTESVPGLSQIAVLRQSRLAAGQWRAVAAEAARSRVDLQAFEFEAATLEAVFAEIVKARPQALIVLSAPVVVLMRARIAELATAARIPSITMFRVYAEAGGLIAYGPDPRIMGHRSASYIVRILRGAAAGDLPIEQPSRFELAVNLATARTLGVTFPSTILTSADVLIE